MLEALILFPKMSKRTAADIQSASTSAINGPRKTLRGNEQSEATGVVMEEGMGEFEDGWEDEFESEDEVVNAEEGEGEDGMCSTVSRASYLAHSNYVLKAWTLMK